MKYNLLLQETLELKTTQNEEGSDIIISFQFEHYDDLSLTFYCDDKTISRWKFIIQECMTDSRITALDMDAVVSDEQKSWLITRTSTKLIVLCNGITVVDFNFATDYTDGFSDCQKYWTSKSTAIYFAHENGIYGNTGPMVMRSPFEPCKLVSTCYLHKSYEGRE